MTQPNGNADQQAISVLEKVRLDLFTADPDVLEPFDSSTITWQVTVPAESEVPVRIRLNDAWSDSSGELVVSPRETQSYQLFASAGQHSRRLGELVVQVNLSTCTTIFDPEVVKFIAAAIQQQIAARASEGVSLDETTNPNPLVTITPDQMNVVLVVGHSVIGADPVVKITLSFGLALVPAPTPFAWHRPVPNAPVRVAEDAIAATNKKADVDISVPWYAWLVPGAMLAIPIAISLATPGIRQDAFAMADAIAAGLNDYFASPPRTYKQNVKLYVDSYGLGEFAVTYCPVPSSPRPINEN